MATATTTHEFVTHPRSGDVYACEVDRDSGRIVRAVGPVHYLYADAAAVWAREIVLNAANDGDALDNGEWLDSEMLA